MSTFRSQRECLVGDFLLANDQQTCRLSPCMASDRDVVVELISFKTALTNGTFGVTNERFGHLNISKVVK